MEIRMNPFLHLVDNRDVDGLAAALIGWRQDSDRRQRDLDNLLIRIADQNPNHRARFANLPQMAHMAIAAGADINANSVFGTPISLATGWGNLDLVNLLLEHGARLDMQADTAPSGSTPKNNTTKPLLHQAIQGGNRKMVIALLDAGAPVDRLDDKGQSALFVACTPSFRTLQRLLVKHGANPKQVDAKGNTLWHAMMSNLIHESKKPDCLPLMAQLMRWGVDPVQQNAEGKTPRDMAQSLRINLVEDFDALLAQAQAKKLASQTPSPVRHRAIPRF